MSCGCLGVLYKPRYRRQVDAIYPRDPMDEKLIRAEMDKLTYYTLHHPEKLDRIGSYLESIMEDGLYKKQVHQYKSTVARESGLRFYLFFFI